MFKKSLNWLLLKIVITHKLNTLLIEIVTNWLDSQQAPWLDSHQTPWLDSQQAPLLDSHQAPRLDS